MSGDPILGGATSHAKPEVKQKVGVKVRASLRGSCPLSSCGPEALGCDPGLPVGPSPTAWTLGWADFSFPKAPSPHWEGPPSLLGLLALSSR